MAKKQRAMMIAGGLVCFYIFFSNVFALAEEFSPNSLDSDARLASNDSINPKICDQNKSVAAFLDSHPLFGLLFLQLNRNLRDGQQSSDNKDERYFTQWLDHFGPRTDSFKQRYFANEEYFVFNSTVEEQVIKNILFIGGPNALASNAVHDEVMPHVAAAKKFKANLFALEHRFYGQSLPNADASIENLHWLNTNQAIKDIAHFIQRKNSEILQSLNLTTSNYNQPKQKWILFSHSTPLALWFCQKYAEEYCSGVVASSPAGIPVLSFFQYQKHVEESFAAVGGQSCVRLAAAAVRDLRQQVQSVEGREKLSKTLSLKPAFSDHAKLHYSDFQHFFALIATTFQAAAQYNDIQSLGIAKVCQILEENKNLDSAEQIAKVLSLYRLYSTRDGMPNSYELTVKHLRDETPASPYLNARLWLYQTCNEFGFSPTTDYGSGWFGATIPNNFFIDLCSDTFGEQYDVESIQSGLDHTISHNGFGVYLGKNAVVTSGQLDPWRSVLVHDAMHPDSVRLVEIAGASHAADFLSFDLISPAMNCVQGIKSVRHEISSEIFQRPEIQSAREIISEQVAHWFLEPEIIKSLATDDSVIDTNFNLLDHPKKYAEEVKHNKIKIVKKDKTTLQSKRIIKNFEAKVEFESAPVNVKADIQALFAAQQDMPRNLGLIHKQRQSFNEQMEQKLRDAFRGQALPLSDGANVQKGKIYQDLDHFSGQPSGPTASVVFTNNTDETSAKRSDADKTWVQYFYRNDQYWKPGGPAFLLIGGEGAINSHWVLEYWHSSVWARKFGADIYALEHRFYGDSLPTGGNFSTENLKLLTSEQALADAAVFIRSMNTRFNYSKWVVFGGSYAGNLAAWFREKYPELAIGAIASSAPVLTKVDYFEYKQVVQNAVKLYGSYGCAENIRKFFELLEKAYASKDGRKTLAKALNLCNDDGAAGWHGAKDFVDEHDIWLMGDTFGDNVLSTVVQYDDQGTYPDMNHRRLLRHCKKFEVMKEFTLPEVDSKIDWTTLEGLLKRLAKSLNMAGGDDGECQTITYQNDLNNRRDITSGGWRTWFWQTCNEFGFFQSTNSGRNIFESSIPINLQVDTCSDVFGPEFDRNYVEARSAYMNEFFGARDFNGTNVVFLNGSEDPWHYMSIIDQDTSPHPSVKAALSEGTSHCSDMISEREYDVPSLKHTRAIAEAELTKWLSQRLNS